MRKFASIGIIAIVTSLSACTPQPKQRSWVLFTATSYDEELDLRYMTYAALEARRAKALASLDRQDVHYYIDAVVRYLWEVDPLLVARDRAASDPEYKYVAPADIAALDRAALIAETEAFLVEYEATHGYQPGLWGMLTLITGDCESVSHDAALSLSCEFMPGTNDFDYPKAVCGEITTVCRQTLDRMVDPDARYYLLKACAESMIEGTSVSKEDALATWLNPEELEFYRTTQQEMERRGAMILAQVDGARADAHAENERRLEEYEEASARHAAEAPEVNRHSQIGSLDPDDQPPPPPALITGVSIETGVDPDGRRLNTDTVTLAFENQCERPIGVTIVDTEKTKKVGPGKRITLELRRCGAVRIEHEDKSPETLYFPRAAAMHMASDCSSLGWDRLEPLEP